MHLYKKEQSSKNEMWENHQKPQETNICAKQKLIYASLKSNQTRKFRRTVDQESITQTKKIRISSAFIH